MVDSYHLRKMVGNHWLEYFSNFLVKKKKIVKFEQWIHSIFFFSIISLFFIKFYSDFVRLAMIFYTLSIPFFIFYTLLNLFFILWNIPNYWRFHILVASLTLGFLVQVSTCLKWKCCRKTLIFVFRIRIYLEQVGTCTKN